MPKNIKILRYNKRSRRYHAITEDGDVWVLEANNIGLKGWYKCHSFKEDQMKRQLFDSKQVIENMKDFL